MTPHQSYSSRQKPARPASHVVVATIAGLGVLTGLLIWGTTFTTHVMNMNPYIPMLLIAGVAGFGFVAGATFQRGAGRAVSIALSVVVSVGLCAYYMAMGSYRNNEAHRVDAIEMTEEPFEVNPRAPYVQAQAVLSKRAGDLSGRVSAATYVPNHPAGARWTVLVDGLGIFQPMVGVVEWDPASGRVSDCRFDTAVDSLNGSLWNSLVREIHKAPGGRGHLVVKEDAWGYCADGEPVIVAPLEQKNGFLHAASAPSGVAVVDGAGNITLDFSVEPGEYPGPVVSTSVARRMWEANRAIGGLGAWYRKTGTYTGPGQVDYAGDDSAAGDVNVEGGNASEFLTTTADGRLVYVTPLSVYGSSQSVTAVAITYADEIRGKGTQPTTVIHRFSDALPSPGDADQVIRAEFGDLPWAAGLSVMEVAPLANGRMIATLGQTTVATWTAEITGNPDGGNPKVCITSVERGITRCSTDDSVTPVDGDGRVSDPVDLTDLSALTDEELSELLRQVGEELSRRLKN